MSAIMKLAGEIDEFELVPGYRGVPAGSGSAGSRQVASQHWRPADGNMSLPLLSADLDVFEQNKVAMLDICARFGCEIAPHIKTPMSPVLARDLIASGAWGVSVADLRQAEVMLRYGVRKLLISNEIGGAAAVARLAKMIRFYDRPDIYMFVDSIDVIDALSKLWNDDQSLPPLKLLIEIGCGRGGVNTNDEASAIIKALADRASDRIVFAGIAAYEGTANRPDHNELMANLDDLFLRVEFAMKEARRVIGKGVPLILSMGGSSLFDYVIDRCRGILNHDGEATLLLRSGACFFSDHGPIRSRLQAMAQRNVLGDEASNLIAGSFNPVLRLWAEVLSLNGEHDAVCGFGLRDVAHDQGLPVPVALWRDGKRLADLGADAEVVKLNDQHAFVKVGTQKLRVGDVLELGVKHPCTTIDKHGLLFGLDSGGDVNVVLRTFFG